MKVSLLNEIAASKEFFERTISVFDESDANFRPREAMLSVCEHVGHAGHTVDWFLEGMSSEKGFNLDFEEEAAKTSACKNLFQAKLIFSEATQRLEKHVQGLTNEDLLSLLPEGPVLGSEARFVVISSVADHTAHHRGALAVYARLLGKIPPLPYGDF